jgi:hypothetical protein
VSILLDLIEQLQRGNGALFLGGDLPAALTGLPARADLVVALAGRLGIVGPPPAWPEVAARYQAQNGRNALIRWLQDQLEPAGRQAGPVYSALAQLPLTTFITATYDTRLHQALREAGRRPNLPVVGAGSLGLLEATRPTVVKLLGVRDRPDSLVLTAADLQRLPQSKAQLLAGLVGPALANKTVLIVGQDLRDTHFQTLYQTALFQAGTIRPLAYAVWEELAEWEKETWSERGVRVIEAPVMEALRTLAGQGEAVEGVSFTPTASVVASPGAPAEAPDYDTAAVRELLTAAFSDEELTTLCFDHFRPVYEAFASGMSKGQKIQRLVEYCDRNLRLDELLRRVAEINPRQYECFRDQLTRS